jgi:hypothetical protein
MNDKSIYTNFTPLTADLQGWNYEHDIFERIINDTKPKTIIEVGTWKGASAITMANIARCKVYCVDTWLGSLEFYIGEYANTPERDLMLKHGYPQVYYQFISNVIHAGLQDFIIPIPATSSTGAAILKAREVKAELIYIDGSHEYEDVKADIKNYKELCTGIMFGDDYNWPAVKQAVDEMIPGREVVDNNYWIWQQKA